jgi:hypothetical protein
MPRESREFVFANIRRYCRIADRELERWEQASQKAMDRSYGFKELLGDTTEAWFDLVADLWSMPARNAEQGGTRNERK